MNKFYESSAIKEINRLIWKVGTFKIRLLGFISPKVTFYDSTKLVVKVKLNKRTKNHFNSMYLGSLVMGADLSAGVPYAYFAIKEKLKFSLVFASMESRYLKRPNSDVYFEVKDLSIFESLLEETRTSGERCTKDINVDAFTFYDDISKTEKVATFTFGLSVKVKI